MGRHYILSFLLKIEGIGGIAFGSSEDGYVFSRGDEVVRNE